MGNHYIPNAVDDIRFDRDMAWDKYWDTKSNESLEVLITLYRDIMGPSVNAAIRRKPAIIQNDEIEAAALIGLYQSIVAYDDDMNISFEVYAPWRIRGSIIDEINSMTLPGFKDGPDGVLDLNNQDSENKEEVSYEQVLRSLPHDVSEFMDLVFNRGVSVEDLARRAGLTPAFGLKTKSDVLKTIKITFQDNDGKYKKKSKSNKSFDKLIVPVRKLLSKAPITVYREEPVEPLENIGLTSQMIPKLQLPTHRSWLNRLKGPIKRSMSF